MSEADESICQKGKMFELQGLRSVSPGSRQESINEKILLLRRAKTGPDSP